MSRLNLDILSRIVREASEGMAPTSDAGEGVATSAQEGNIRIRRWMKQPWYREEIGRRYWVRSALDGHYIALGDTVHGDLWRWSLFFAGPGDSKATCVTRGESASLLRAKTDATRALRGAVGAKAVIAR